MFQTLIFLRGFLTIRYPFMFHDIVFSHDILSHIEITSSKASNFKYIEYLAHCICVVVSIQIQDNIYHI